VRAFSACSRQYCVSCSKIRRHLHVTAKKMGRRTAARFLESAQHQRIFICRPILRHGSVWAAGSK
jgi:hypothetical protein